MEATAAPRALSLLVPSPPPPRLNPWRVAVGGGVGRRGAVAVGAKKRRGRGGDGDGEAEERVDKHSFAPKDGEATGPFPEAVLLRKKMVREDGQVSPEFADADEEKLYEFLNIQLESDLNLKRMRHYEVVYLIHEDRVEEVEDLVSKVQEFVREKKGRIWRLNNWGLRRLAYKIKKATHANYILMNFEIESRYINDFKTLLDKDERIIRHLVMKRDEAVTEDCPPPPEFHTLRAQQYMNDEYDEDEEEVEEEEGVDAGRELESAGYDDDDVEAGDGPEIIFVDEADQNKHENIRRRNRKLKVKKYTVEKVLR
ncbi:protein REGULATOR OF FATTY ACID COMPOSITION 3, chloroplastic [Phragmites australis]|uniref:protein REGULATOR OF FATTY ACID COMPOSITION 3, chloroplastic n=1 Tax=Phragmites australis TaxID=29695 RepID=UPI002D777299|nr:protein REGULATOR OF FATTY ACID COMPOSITION 3, chloroplastic [Phragmites australis]